jgi:hypothetical protein
MSQDRIITTPWASDTQISMPEPIDPAEVLLDMGGGFAFTADGMRHLLSQSDVRNLSVPYFGPEEVEL